MDHNGCRRHKIKCFIYQCNSKTKQKEALLMERLIHAQQLIIGFGYESDQKTTQSKLAGKSLQLTSRKKITGRKSEQKSVNYRQISIFSVLLDSPLYSLHLKSSMWMSVHNQSNCTNLLTTLFNTRVSRKITQLLQDHVNIKIIYTYSTNSLQ